MTYPGTTEDWKKKDGKVALLTGGSRGIGAATMELLQRRGWEIFAPTRAQLSLDSAIQAHAVRLPHALYGLDALILCAGQWYSRPLRDQDGHAWHYQYMLNVVSSFDLIRFCLSALERVRGCVVAVASTRAFIGGVETAPYSVAKAGLVALMQGFAREYGGEVRFNCVCPGLTDTDMGRDVIATGGAKPDAVPQPAEAVAAEIVRLIESDDNGRIMRVVDGVATEAKWNW